MITENGMFRRDKAEPSPEALGAAVAARKGMSSSSQPRAPWLPAGTSNPVGRRLAPQPRPLLGTCSDRQLHDGMSSSAADILRTTNATIISRQLERGAVEVNVAGLSLKDAAEFASNLAVAAPRVRALRLKVLHQTGFPNKVSSGHHHSNAALQEGATGQRFLLHSEWHKDAVSYASATLQHKKVRFPLYSALLDILLQSDIRELELGMRLSTSGYKMLCEGLARTCTLRRLSLAGSHLGDANILLLQEGLETNCSLEELDLTACGLSDDSAACVASVIKRHADRRVNTAFHRHLREYPDLSLGEVRAQANHRHALHQAARDVDAACGGLMHVELAENEVTDSGAAALCHALSFDRRLVLLSLRANALTNETEHAFVELMRDHRALARVDLRQNVHADMGILKLQKPASVAAFNMGLGFTRRGLSAPPSPARTEASKALWELFDSASCAEMSILGGPSLQTYGGGAGMSDTGVLATFHQSDAGSMLSWEDAALLAASQPSLPPDLDSGGVMSGDPGSPAGQPIVQPSGAAKFMGIHHEEHAAAALRVPASQSIVTLSSIHAQYKQMEPQQQQHQHQASAGPFAELPLSKAVHIFGEKTSTQAVVNIAAVPKRKSRKRSRMRRRGTDHQKAIPEPHASAVNELAHMFKDLEVAVSSLELLYELRQGTPKTSVNKKQVEQTRKHAPQHDQQAVAPSIPSYSSHRESSRVLQAASTELPPSITDVAQQLQRWRDLCDTALL